MKRVKLIAITEEVIALKRKRIFRAFTKEHYPKPVMKLNVNTEIGLEQFKEILDMFERAFKKQIGYKEN